MLTTIQIHKETKDQLEAPAPVASTPQTKKPAESVFIVSHETKSSTLKPCKIYIPPLKVEVAPVEVALIADTIGVFEAVKGFKAEVPETIILFAEKVAAPVPP